MKKDHDENVENEENNDYQEVDNDYDEDKPIKRKKKRGPKGEGKVKVSYTLGSVSDVTKVAPWKHTCVLPVGKMV